VRLLKLETSRLPPAGLQNPVGPTCRPNHANEVVSCDFLPICYIAAWERWVQVSLMAIPVVTLTTVATGSRFPLAPGHMWDTRALHCQATPCRRAWLARKRRRLSHEPDYS
jgi:hypothetical protein